MSDQIPSFANSTEEKRRALENCLPMLDLLVKGIDAYRERCKMLDEYVNDDELTDGYAQIEWVRGIIFWHITGIYPWSDMAQDHDLNNPDRTL